jgi:hypothetical protein
MHRKWGASIMAGTGVKTASYNGRDENTGTLISPGAAGGLNLRFRLSPKSSLQLSGNLVLDRYTIRGHIHWISSYRVQGTPDTTYSERHYGDLELQELYWQGALSYRYTLNYRWGASLGIRVEGLLSESGTYRRTNYKEYRRVGSESTLVRDVNLDGRDGWYYIYNDSDGGLQTNIYCQLNRRLQLMASLDKPLPFFKFYGYTYSRYKLVLAHRIF